MRFMLLLVPLLAFASFVPSAEAAQPPPQCINPGSGCCFAPCQPLVGVCVDDVNHPSCYDGAWICVGFSYQVPQCVDHLSVECTEICNPCVKINCDVGPLVGACVDGVTNDGCYGDAWICVGFSTQIPVCVDHVVITCQSPCIPNPCETPYFDCAPGPIVTSGPEPMCMYYYYEIDTGIVRYVQRDSCHNEIYVNGERVK